MDQERLMAALPLVDQVKRLKQHSRRQGQEIERLKALVATETDAKSQVQQELDEAQQTIEQLKKDAAVLKRKITLQEKEIKKLEAKKTTESKDDDS